MQQLRILLFTFFVLFMFASNAQQLTYEEVNTKSFSLYEKKEWKQLLSYGKEALTAGQDFTLLRLRMGYAAFMLENYSEAINQYEVVLKKDSYNSVAHYYVWLCRKYLNQNELAERELKYFSKEDLKKMKLGKVGVTAVGFEVSLKTTDLAQRGNTNFEMLKLQNRFGWNVHMYQAGSMFNQTIQQPSVPPTPINPYPPLKNINISQPEYYNKLTINADKHWQLKTAYHFTGTTLDNTSFNNQAVMVGVKYNSSYFDVQADGIFANVSDSSLSQFNAQLGIYPLGNLNLYSFSTAMFRNRPSGSYFNFKEVIGFKLLKKVWLEANATLGNFNDLYENDAFYIYNAIDKNLFKGGVTTYITISPKCTFELGYALEQRELLKKLTQFNQHSITGGLSWKF